MKHALETTGTARLGRSFIDEAAACTLLLELPPALLEEFALAGAVTRAQFRIDDIQAFPETRLAGFALGGGGRARLRRAR